MRLPTIDENSELIVIPLQPPVPVTPPPLFPPPAYETIRPQHDIRSIHRTAPEAPERVREMHFGWTLRTAILTINTGSALVNTGVVVFGNLYLGFGIPHLLLVATWIFHAVVFVAVGGRSISMIKMLSNFRATSAIFFFLIIAILSGLLVIIVTYTAISSHPKDTFQRHRNLFLNVLGFLIFIGVFTIESFFQVRFMNALNEELGEEIDEAEQHDNDDLEQPTVFY